MCGRAATSVSRAVWRASPPGSWLSLWGRSAPTCRRCPASPCRPRPASSSASSRWTRGAGVAFDVVASMGRTKLDGQPSYRLQTAAWSSAWKMELSGNCRTLGLICTGVHLSLSQPLRIEQGNFSAVLPDVPADISDPLTFSTRQFSASPSGREVDLRLMARPATSARLGVVSLKARGQPSSRATAPDAPRGVRACWAGGGFSSRSECLEPRPDSPARRRTPPRTWAWSGGRCSC